MTEHIIAFAKREADLAPLTIALINGQAIARPRRDEDQLGGNLFPQYGDVWTHVKSRGAYVRLRDVLDTVTGQPSYHYQSVADGEGWVRPVAEWFARIDGHWRFERGLIQPKLVPSRTALDDVSQIGSFV